MEGRIDLTPYQTAVYKEKLPLFERFFSLLTEYNARFNLTAITEKEEVFEKHFLDSAAGERFFPNRAAVLEVGSGAGFPSLPLKILRDDLCFTLVESTGKKCEFLRTAVRELGLPGVEVVCGRAEELAREARYRERFDAVCARAVARMNTLSEYCLPFVKKGGVFLAYKGEAREEAEEASSAVKLLGGAPAESFFYDLPHGKRTLLLVKKIRSTPKAYPRGRGKERKDPL